MLVFKISRDHLAPSSSKCERDINSDNPIPPSCHSHSGTPCSQHDAIPSVRRAVISHRKHVVGSGGRNSRSLWIRWWRTWSLDRPSGLVQSRLRESPKRTAFEREVNAPAEPRRVSTALDPVASSVARRCALPCPIPALLASTRHVSPRLIHELALPSSATRLA